MTLPFLCTLPSIIIDSRENFGLNNGRCCRVLSSHAFFRNVGSSILTIHTTSSPEICISNLRQTNLNHKKYGILT